MNIVPELPEVLAVLFELIAHEIGAGSKVSVLGTGEVNKSY